MVNWHHVHYATFGTKVINAMPFAGHRRGFKLIPFCVNCKSRLLSLLVRSGRLPNTTIWWILKNFNFYSLRAKILVHSTLYIYTASYLCYITTVSQITCTTTHALHCIDIIVYYRSSVKVIYVSPDNVFAAHISLGIRISPHTYTWGSMFPPTHITRDLCFPPNCQWYMFPAMMFGIFTGAHIPMDSCSSHMIIFMFPTINWIASHLYSVAPIKIDYS